VLVLQTLYSMINWVVFCVLQLAFAGMNEMCLLPAPLRMVLAVLAHLLPIFDHALHFLSAGFIHVLTRI